MLHARIQANELLRIDAEILTISQTTSEEDRRDEQSEMDSKDHRSVCLHVNAFEFQRFLGP